MGVLERWLPRARPCGPWTAGDAHHGANTLPQTRRTRRANERVLTVAVPLPQEMLLPLLRWAAEREGVFSFDEAEAGIADALGLSDEDRAARYPKHRGLTYLRLRLSNALGVLRRRGLVQDVGVGPRVTGGGPYVFTDDGRRLLADARDQLSYADLPSRRQVGAPPDAERAGPEEATPPALPPQELIEDAYCAYRAAMAADLLEQAKRCSPAFFEKLVIDLLLRMGYGGSERDAAQAVGGTGDGGIDGIIKQDPPGLEMVYIQAKRWEGTVGRPEVQGFAGSLMGQGAAKGVLITTSSFSKGAIDYAAGLKTHKVVLIDGNQLADYMIDHDIGVSEERRYVVKRVDYDYFEDV
jgi:restriction system protein